MSGQLFLHAVQRAHCELGVTRNDRAIAEAVVAETRDDICGLLVQNLRDDADPVRVGDVAALKVE